MSEENGKVCCNCRHCIRKTAPDGYVTCHCEIDDNRYIGYIECMIGWCKHWATDAKYWEQEE